MTPNPSAQTVTAEACQFCGTVPHGDDEPSCGTYAQAMERTSARPYGCPWFTKMDQRRYEKAQEPTIATLTSSLAAASARIGEERDAIAARAREFAAHYPESSDGRNTFILFAEWIEARTLEGEK